MEKPNKGLCLLYSEARKDMIGAVNDVINRHHLPLYMIDGILSAIISEMRLSEVNQTTAEYADYSNNLDQYYKQLNKGDEEDG